MPTKPPHNTQHTQQKSEGQATKHNGGVWLVKPSLAFPSTLQQQQEEEEEERTEGWGERDRKKGGGTKTSGCWWWWRDGHWWHHTHELTEKTEALCPSTITNTRTHRQEKDRDKEKDRTRQRTRSGRWVWLCKKRRRKQVGWWVTTSHKSTQGKAKQPSLTPFLSSTPPFPLPFPPFSFYSFSPYIMDYTLLKLKNTLNSFFPFLSLKNTHKKKNKMKEQ